MQTTRTRKELIEQLYAACPERWPDVRRYRRYDDIERRLFTLRERIKTYPVKKVASRNASAYRLLVNEFRLIKAQVSVLSVDAVEDEDLYAVRARIESSLWNPGQVYSKHAHTLILLHFVWAKFTDEQLAQQVAAATTVKS